MSSASTSAVMPRTCLRVMEHETGEVSAGKPESGAVSCTLEAVAMVELAQSGRLEDPGLT